MRTTATTAQISGLQTWVRTVLLTAGLALLVAAPPQPVGAEQIPQTPSDAGTNQVLACRMMGGTATSDSNRTGDGLISTTVTCRVPGLGGWVCYNGRYTGTMCWAIPPSGATAPSKWQDILGGEVLPVLESGSATEINARLAELEATDDEGPTTHPSDDQGPTAHPSVDSGNNQEHQQATGGDQGKPGKQGKHGKKGGKHRKK